MIKSNSSARNMFDVGENSCDPVLCIQSNKITTKQVCRSLGIPLGKVVCDYSHTEAKEILGLDPLESAPCNLSSSHDNIDKAKLSSPYRIDVIKAVVHRDILELGEKLLQKFLVETQQDAEKNFQYNVKDVFRMYQAKKHRENQLNLHDLHCQYEDYIKTVQTELEQRLQTEWKNMITKLTKKWEKCRTNERVKQTQEFLKVMRSEIRYIITILYDEFDQHFRAQKQNMIADFNEIMRNHYLKTDQSIKALEEKHIQELRIQRQELKVQNIVDQLHLLCGEKSQKFAEQHAVHMNLKNEVNQLQNLVVELKDTISEMRVELEGLKEDKKSVEEQLTECKGEFKKLIYFTLHAMPEHAEYLLPLEKYCS